MAKYTAWKTVIVATILITFLFVLITETSATSRPQAPNFQYFERPKYRFPYYDENGKGNLLYGYGGKQLYRYTTYSALEGIH